MYLLRSIYYPLYANCNQSPFSILHPLTEEVCRQFENAGVTAIVTLPMLLPVAEMFKSKMKHYKGTICIGGKHDLDKNIYGFEVGSGISIRYEKILTGPGSWCSNF